MMNQSKAKARNKPAHHSFTSIDINFTDKVMPRSPEAEVAVLGSMILDPACIGWVVQKLRADAFYSVEHQYIFDSLVAVWEGKGNALDAVLLRDELKKRGWLAEVGGAEYIARIIDSVPSATNVEHYAGIVRERQLLRELIVTSSEIINNCFGDGDVGEMLDEAEQRIFAVTEKKISGSAVAISQILDETFELFDSRDGEILTGLSTGFHDLNNITCGLQKGEMIIVAGRPSMGKTSFALNMAEHIGADEERPVAVFSCAGRSG